MPYTSGDVCVSVLLLVACAPLMKMLVAAWWAYFEIRKARAVESEVSSKTKEIEVESTWLRTCSWFKCPSCAEPLIVDGCAQIQHRFNCSSCGLAFGAGQRLTTKMNAAEINSRITSLCKEQAKEVVERRYIQEIATASADRLPHYPSYLIHRYMSVLRSSMEDADRKLKEADKNFKDTDRQLKETDNKFKEADKKLQEIDQQLKEAERVKDLFSFDSKVKLEVLIKEAVEHWRGAQDKLSKELLTERQAAAAAQSEHEAMKKALLHAKADADSKSDNLAAAHLQLKKMLDKMANLQSTLGSERAAVWSERLAWMEKEKRIQEEADHASSHMHTVLNKLRQRDEVGCFLRDYVKRHGASGSFGVGQLEPPVRNDAEEARELNERLLRAEHQCKLSEVSLEDCKLKMRLLGTELQLLKADIQEHGIDLKQMKAWSCMMSAQKSAKTEDSDQASSNASIDANWVYDMSAWDEIVAPSTAKGSPAASEAKAPTATLLLHEDERRLSESICSAEEQAGHKTMESMQTSSACAAEIKPEETMDLLEGNSFPQHGDDKEKRDAAGVVILGFNKHPIEFTSAISETMIAETLCQRGVDISPDWANGAKILVEGLTPALMEEGGFAPEDLRVWHVVMLPEHQNEVLDSLKTLPYRTRPREKSRNTIMCQMGSNSEQPSGDSPVENSQEAEATLTDKWQHVQENDADIIGKDLIVSRTFIDINKDLRVDLSPRSVYTKSSNDRHGIENPRRWK
mmetsp:Transcript_6799/g.12608  ORF Transcript_6799/g.12608 Transcript_6799/m.12608 type:complete len:744 (-) Transcript_6799:170-2401(-)